MTLDHFLDRHYDIKNYNCGHFVVEVWEYLTGQNIAPLIVGNFSQMRHNFTRIEKPESPCLVVLISKKVLPHVGIFWQGKMIHLNPLIGARWEYLDLLPDHYTQYFYK